MCINRLYNKNSLIGYELQDERGNLINCTKQMIVQILRRGDTIVNIKVLKDGRLYTNANKKQIVKSKYIRKTNKIILYHGQPNKVVKPQFGLGKDYHDYGKGFYTTKDLQLACEWAACDKEQAEGYVHAFELDLTGLNILNFDMLDDLNWIAELLQHRQDSKVKNNIAYRRKQIISRYKINTQDYDLIVGWRADQSYFRIAKVFLDDRLSIQQLREALRYGDLGVQYTLKQEKAYNQLKYLGVKQVDYQKYSKCYWSRDGAARCKLRDIENRIPEPGYIRIQTLLAEGELL